MKKQEKNPDKLEDSATGNNKMNEAEHTEQLHEIPESGIARQGTSRRDFLKVLGFSFASAAVLASCKRPVHEALPYITQPPEITPGKSLYYATSFYDGHEYCGILVKTRDGRPIKIEGNDLSVFNGEGTTARVQASILSLYDDARLKGPAADNKKSSWAEVDEKVIGELARINSGGGAIVLLTSSIISPTTIRLIGEFGARFKNFKWVQYDAISYSALLEANSLCFGKAVIPDYHFRNADIVVSVNADFLGTWLSPVHFIPSYVSGRKLNNGERNMLKHIHFESGMSLTGANADIRKKIKPSEEKSLLADLYNKIAQKAGSELLPAPAFREDLSELADKLMASGGRSIVVSGTNNVDIQIIVNGINSLLGNYEKCIDLNNNLNIASGIDSQTENFFNDLNGGKVKALLMYNVNPVYDYQDSNKILSGIKNTELSVNMAATLNETVGKAKYECPVNHYLESWDDSEPVPGQLSLSQPCISPLFNTRSFQDSLLKWSGSSMLYHEYLKANWEKVYFPLSKDSDFRNFWNHSLGNGVFNYTVSSGSQLKLRTEELSRTMKSVPVVRDGGYEVIIAESVALGTGMHANNPWLMELPDPVSRQCWENVAAISPADAQKLGIDTGTLIKIAEGLILPAFIQPGQAEGTISVAPGYGHTGSGPVCNNIGVNLYPFVKVANGNREYGFSTDKIENTHKNSQLALTQVHHSMEGRPIVRETGLSEYLINPAAGNELHAEFESTHETLYPEVKYDGFHWGMAIDLNACIGCNSCVIACQAENNIPVVGKSEVIKEE